MRPINEKDRREAKIEASAYEGSIVLKGKRELFAQLLASRTKNQTEAHRDAGYKSWKGAKRYAHVLATNTVIKKRIAYLQAEMAKKLEITRETQIKKLIEHEARCLKDGDNRTYLSTVSELSRLCGLIIDKKEDVKPTERARLNAEQADQARKEAEILIRESIKAECTEEPTVVDWTNGG